MPYTPIPPWNYMLQIQDIYKANHHMYEKDFLLSFVYFVPFDTVCPGIFTVLQFDLWQEVDPDVIRFCSVYIVFQGCS